VISAQFLETHPEGGPADIGGFAGISCGSPRVELLIAMQKVVGSNPISRFGKTCDLQVFLVARVLKLIRS
jgi:hypothetical protein